MFNNTHTLFTPINISDGNGYHEHYTNKLSEPRFKPRSTVAIGSGTSC